MLLSETFVNGCWLRPRIKGASKCQHDPLSNQRCLSRVQGINYIASCGEFVDCRIKLTFTAFLFEALIFFATIFYQEKKVGGG